MSQQNKPKILSDYELRNHRWRIRIIWWLSSKFALLLLISLLCIKFFKPIWLNAFLLPSGIGITIFIVALILVWAMLKFSINEMKYWWEDNVADPL